jgi:hypothetical protein
MHYWIIRFKKVFLVSNYPEILKRAKDFGFNTVDLTFAIKSL